MKIDLDSLLWCAQILRSLMTREERIEHDKAQKKSWVYGQVKLSNPNVTKEMVNRIVEGQK